jgi:hypothetical protein
LTLPRGCPSSLPAIDLILIGFDDHRKEPQGTTRNKKPHKKPHIKHEQFESEAREAGPHHCAVRAQAVALQRQASYLAANV